MNKNTPEDDGMRKNTPEDDGLNMNTPRGDSVTVNTPEGEDRTVNTPRGEDRTVNTPRGEDGTVNTPGGEVRTVNSSDMKDEAGFDPVMLRIMMDTFISIPEEMGRALRRTAYSPNIKERMDASCALFNGEGVLLAQAEHIPVHLGSMPMVVKQVLREYTGLDDGDAILVNDPSYGGTHLPDLTVIMPVFFRGKRIAFVVNRAHHADIGGMTPGSMPAGSSELYQEGLVIPPVKILVNEKENMDIINFVLANTRTPVERLGDLRAQLSACSLGKRRFLEMVDRYGIGKVEFYEKQSLDYSRKLTREQLRSIPDGQYDGEEQLERDRYGFTDYEYPREDDVVIKVGILVDKGRISVDFAGTDDELNGNLNAPSAVTHSAVAYVFRCIAGSDIPNNDGCTRDITIRIPKGTILNPSRNLGVCSGNVETSQRIVEALFSAMSKALPESIPAGSQGTMNNTIIGGREFSYYETLGGGEGAYSWRNGENGIHTGMTNTANTPIEAIEIAYPLRIREYSIIRGSGGVGKFRGGDGLRRVIEVMSEDAVLSILSNNRRLSPGGRNGGESGRPGRNLIKRRESEIILPSMADITLVKGDIVVVETPGGGGWGEE